ncbi:MAG: FAD-binding oxidoreductase, partial [Acidobacteriota bacterium]
NSCINSVEDYLKAGLPRQAGAILIIEVDGSPLQTEKEMELISALCQKEGASQLKIAASAQEAEQMWKVRRSLSPAIASIRDSKINEDVVVPRSRIPQLVSHIEELKRELKVVIPAFGHAGDGNLHLNFMYNKDDQDEAQRIQRALHSVLRKVIELGGSLSGEHGIGFTKAPYISMELDQQTINLMKSIKKIFDPNNILNPGKIFPPDEEE